MWRRGKWNAGEEWNAGGSQRQGQSALAVNTVDSFMKDSSGENKRQFQVRIP
jgi:hypothetical protein